MVVPILDLMQHPLSSAAAALPLAENNSLDSLLHCKTPVVTPYPSPAPVHSLLPPPYGPNTVANTGTFNSNVPTVADDDYGLNLSELMLEDITMDANEYTDIMGSNVASSTVCEDATSDSSSIESVSDFVDNRPPREHVHWGV